MNIAVFGGGKVKIYKLSFKYGNEELAIAVPYVYLGIKFDKNRTFAQADVGRECKKSFILLT